MSSNPEYDVIVVGAGIVGSCTAYHCRKLGLKTLQLEQYNLGHWHGSSHGMSRITRMAHTHAPYIPVVKDSFAQIAEFEKKRGEKLWANTGLVWMADHATIDGIAKTVGEAGFEHEVLSSAEALFDPMGGMIYPEKWLKAYQEEYRNLGGIVHEDETFDHVSESGDTVTVHTNKGSYTTKKAMICVGTWLQTVFPDIAKITRLQPQRICVAYWKPKDPKDLSQFSLEKMPVVIIDDKTTGEEAFALPIRDYPDAIKYCKYFGDAYNVGDAEKEFEAVNLDQPKAHLAKHFPLIDASAPAHVDKCKYTVSPDKHYVFDWHPKFKNVFIGGCMSGSGFKVSPGFGRALAHLAAGEESPFDLSMFSLKRFKDEQKQ
ncbi:unnamed protein product, partial [Mesorhabditis belari]|uniref:FAD dependent oxidoreductase domain-containing protein n=1 Tax=Mesorhabditis belari TaxID=2138241 RepID=A0AAF3EDY9_9BILA